ncbi:hypothetical protein V5799_011525 [Amblyomma americanum]|uniref:CCHC-type domain-containing protein n=1 Tax=Amblyomma americanum TaxID=6943 RepID=A0AAQ4E6A2_AMBAM
MASAVCEYDRVSAAKFVDYKFFVPPLPAPHQPQKTVFLHCDPDGRPYKFDDMVDEFKRLSLMEKLGGCGQYQRNHIWQVYFKDPDHLQPLLDAGELTVKGRRCLVIDPCFKRVHFILHWVPIDVRDRAVRRVVKRFGSVDHMVSEKVPAEAKWRSVWARVTLKDGLAMDDVPHLLRLKPGSMSLVVIVGREPLCLRCNQKGHLRRVCGAVRCGLCARVGHADVDCPRRPPPEAETASGKSRKGKGKKKKKNKSKKR